MNIKMETPSLNGTEKKPPLPRRSVRKSSPTKKSTLNPSTATSRESLKTVRPFVYIDELQQLKTKDELLNLLNARETNPKKLIQTIHYESELEKLQVELVKLQQWVVANKIRVAIVFEGRDAAGKGGTIRRFTEHLNPRSMRVVALNKPSDEEQGQWYFQRYIKQLPNKGEIVFFDRSWYNRAVVEPVNGFCNQKQYEIFMQQVTEFEHMLYEDGILLFKFWFSISKEEQLKRFKSRMGNPLKHWKVSPVDMKAQEKWDLYTRYKEMMFNKTHSSFSPWIIVKANNKQKARLEAIRFLLAEIDYAGKEKNSAFLLPNKNIVNNYHRNALRID